MKKTKILEKRIAILNIIVLALVVLGIVLVIVNQVCSVKYDLCVDDEKKLVENVKIYKDASDYLIKQSFAYIGSEDRKYYDNYMIEVNTQKRREAAVSNIKKLNIKVYEDNLIDKINKHSLELMELEKSAINFLREGKRDEARKVLFSDRYEKKSKQIATDVIKFEDFVRTHIKEELDLLDFILDSAFVGEIVVGLFIMVIGTWRNKIIIELLYIDSLTNKGNRIAFERYINKYGDKIKGIAFLDVNDFKKTNDTLGHSSGDELLIHISECIQKVFNEVGKLYRISGDEFVVLLEKDIDQEDLMYKLQKEYEESSKKIGHRISASCGIAMRNLECPISKEELYFVAEKNMYKAKSKYYKENGIDRRAN